MVPGRKRRTPLNPLEADLAQALGYPDNSIARPHINYISNRHIGILDHYLALFVRVIAHFDDDGTTSNATQKSDSIQALLDELVASQRDEMFNDTEPGSKMRKEEVEDTVMYILGVWTMLQTSFVQLPNSSRRIVMAYRNKLSEQGTPGTGLDDNLASLVKGSGLLPAPGHWIEETHPDDELLRTAMKLVTLLSDSKNSNNATSMVQSLSTSSLLDKFDSKLAVSQASGRSLDSIDSIESLSVKATRLNAFTLSTLGAVEIVFTNNISHHMQLSQHGGRYMMELFALPCVFKAKTLTSDAVGISSELATEIQDSYSILFNAWPDSPLHAKLGAIFGVRKLCWCWSCSAYRYRKQVVASHKQNFKANAKKAKRARDISRRSEYDPQLAKLMKNDESSDWNYDLFPCLWPRITILEEHLQRAKPWSIWILFRDRRDTLQFWTFFFATIVVFMTFLQLALGVAQVVGSFR
ncbi:hypothetical protein P154DRAFT_579546 [Amniculicola lignicola CBS 123094]|uniref:Uncharacterized protein n=1 Tax=Amniculicola lignicola CBS 123094 TaxID=1392246 RepID=A0A6A5WCA7_9PLEO|nr:hypothetical protein P154DRAFT_579546 [Amniculicola lignicola CBS 123094]